MIYDERFVAMVEDIWESLITFETPEDLAKNEKHTTWEYIKFVLIYFFVPTAVPVGIEDSRAYIVETVEEGMFVTERTWRPKNKILIKWKDIKRVYRNPRTQIEIFLDMKDGSKITMTVPEINTLRESVYFTDEFVDFIEKHIPGHDSLVE